MKKIFTLLSAVVLSIAVMAAAPRPTNMLTIQSVNRGDLRVVIDGRRFEPNDNFMRLQGLRPGYHTITIYREKQGGYYNLFGARFERVFKSSITIRNRTNLVITVDRFGRTSIRESRFDGWNNGRNHRDMRDNRDNRGNRGYDDRDFGRDNDDVWDDYKQGQDFIYDTDGQQGDYRFDDRGNYTGAMSDFEFRSVLESISKEWLESNKMKSASQVIRTSNLTSDQVRQMMLLFGMENNRVDLAKQAYSKVIDQRNFLATVNSALSFDSSRDELARYIRSFR